MKKDDFKKLDEFDKETVKYRGGQWVRRDELLSVLKRMGNVAKNNASPILNCVLIEAGNDVCRVTVDNTRIRISVWLNLYSSNGFDTFLVPFSFLEKFCESNRGDEVSFRHEDGKKIAFSCGTSTAVVHSINYVDFPTEQDYNGKVSEVPDSGRFFRDLKEVSKFVSKDDSRHGLHNVHIENDGGKTVMVGTDGKWMFLRETSRVSGISIICGMNIAVLEAKIIAGFFKNSDKVCIKTNNERIGFTTKNELVVVKSGEGTFPNYKVVIPESFPHSIGFSAFLLRWGICSIQAMKGCNVELKIKKNAVELSVYDDFNETEMTTLIPADTGDVPEVSFRMNGKYLYDALLAGEYLTMSFSDCLNPIMLVSEKTKYIIMPIRQTR